MKTSKQLRERIGELLNQAEALHELASTEEREFTAEEQADFDGWLAEVGNDGDNGEPKTGLHAKVASAEKFEGILARSKKPANHVPGVTLSPGPGREPARPARYTAGTLNAFKGATAAEDAYRAGRWFAATLLGDEKSSQWCGENGMTIQAAQTEGDNTKGGYTVPTEVEQAIIVLRERYGVFRRWAEIVPMGSDVKNHTKWISGLNAYAVGERGTITASDVGMERVELIARKWAVLTRLSNELNEDSFISWADLLTTEAARAFAKKEDESGFVGDGTSTYHGITGVMNKVTSGAQVKTLSSGDTSFGEIILGDMEAVVGQLPEYAADGAAWFISRAGYYNSLSLLKDSAGGNNNDDLGSGSGMNFLGYPVVISQVLNSTLTAQTNTNLFCFGNLRLAATLGDRRGMTMATSTDVYFTTDETAVRGTTRYDIKIHGLDTASSEVGPMIIVRTPAS